LSARGWLFRVRFSDGVCAVKRQGKRQLSTPTGRGGRSGPGGAPAFELAGGISITFRLSRTLASDRLLLPADEGGRI
jgi:hypothetical protein